MSECFVIPGWAEFICDRGTKGCDACKNCTCHGCYAHEGEPCECAAGEG